jgi:hypothetical protein
VAAEKLPLVGARILGARMEGSECCRLYGDRATRVTKSRWALRTPLLLALADLGFALI